jgi:hypothetical protein
VRNEVATAVENGATFSPRFLLDSHQPELQGLRSTAKVRCGLLEAHREAP